MEKRRIKRVPVMRGETVVGIVSRANLLHALAGVAREVSRRCRRSSIRERPIGELEKQAWAPVAMIDIVVRNGVVELWGIDTDEHEREAMKVAAENIPGVKEVNDHLALVDPTSGMVFYQPNEPTAAKAL